MLSLLNLATATAKNRVEASQLSTELERIDKEKRNELRMLNNEKQRFKAKYSKSSFSSASSHEAQAAEVKMYETHNPGFCFRRNGEHRIQQAPIAAPPVDFEHLHFLLFTDGEVDIEKVLCLHLLSTHETHHLASPKRLKNINAFLKKETPLEQLIERSEERSSEVASAMILPPYVLDVNKGRGKLFDDERLLDRLLVNEKILELNSTVITTLKDSNPEKMQHLLNMAMDPSSLKRIFRNNYIQEFVQTLKEHSLISNCSSFILTQPQETRACHLEIRTSSGALEDLVRFIRANVLQLPNRDVWMKLQEREIKETKTEARKTVSSPVRRNLNSPKPNQTKTEVRKEISEGDTEISKFRRIPVNFVAKNIAQIGKFFKPPEMDQENLPPKKYNPDFRRGDGNLKIDKKNLVELTDSRDEVKKNSSPTSNRSCKSNATCSEEVKFHLKQTTCQACMEKWRVPLPSPKVSHVTKNTDGCLVEEIKTNSVQRLSTLIEREQYKLNTYDRKYSDGASFACNLHVYQRKGEEARPSLDRIMLDVYDLEKIKQEIREKEARKKLEKFLAV